MKTSAKWLLPAGLGLLLSTSPAQAALRDSLISIRSGASMDEVVAILGTPGDRSFFGSAEAWQYCETGFANDFFVTVWFSNGQVAGLTTENYAGNAILCENNFRAVDWGQLPADVVIEFR